jgi:hypothetical protein
MTLGTMLEAGTSPRSETGYPLAEFRPTTDSARAQPSTPRRLTACSRPTPLPRSSAAPPLHRTDRIFRRTPLVPCASPASAGQPTGLPHMPK